MEDREHAPNESKPPSFPPAAAGAVAGVALVGLIAGGWWLGGRESGVAAAAEPKSATPSAPIASEASPHTGADLAIAEDPEVRRLRAELARDPGRLEKRKQLALRLLRTGSFYAAFEEAGHIVEADPDDVDGLFVLGAVRVRMGQPSRALPLLDRVLEKIPDHVPALTSRGQALLKAGHDAAAVEAWERALELSGGDDRQIEELLRSTGPRAPTAGS